MDVAVMNSVHLHEQTQVVASGEAFGGNQQKELQSYPLKIDYHSSVRSIRHMIIQNDVITLLVGENSLPCRVAFSCLHIDDELAAALC